MGRPCASSSKLTDRQGQWGPVPHPLADCICGRKGRGPAPQAQRSYYWCCYAAIIGAATQLLLVLLRSYYWCGYHGGSAGRHFAISRAAVRKLLPRRISRGLGAVPRGARGEMHRKVPTKCACVFRFKALMSSLKFESSDIKRAHACSSYLHTFHF